MTLIYTGKTKDVYDLENGYYLLKFKDDMTGVDGVFDPGANTVGLSVEGMGSGGLQLTEYFFKKIVEAGYKTHFISADIECAEMTVIPVEIFGKGIEVICRYRAVGSFIRRYGAYATEGQMLDSFIEFTLKDDERGDPVATKDALVMLGVMSGEDYDEIKKITQKICGIIKETLAEKGLELYDIKLEFGRVNDEIILVDEISGGNMRVYKDNAPIDPLELVSIMLNTK